MNHTIPNFDGYITACEEAGLTPDSPFDAIEEVVFEHMERNGFGYGAGYKADDAERDEAWSEAWSIARKIVDLLPE